MASIDDFVNHRWEDAKEALRKLDSDFVSELESEHRLQTLVLDMPQQYSAGNRPKRLLSRKWHHLLEACLELAMQAWNVRVAATSLTAEANAGLSIYEAGLRADYHFRSWFIHVAALTERTDDVIRKTADVYIAESGRSKELAKRHRTSVKQQITERISRQRNEYMHPKRSWASGITENQLWEGHVTIGMTPTKFLDEFHYPAQGKNMMVGKYDGYVDETRKILDCVGSILQKFETDLTGKPITL